MLGCVGVRTAVPCGPTQEVPTVALSVEHQKLAELDELLANMEPRARISLLLRIGMPADVVLGVRTCTEHVGWHQLPANQPLSFDGNCMWCHTCFRWMRS